jgi:predicted Rossmann-fold nucleotide-binding protein
MKHICVFCSANNLEEKYTKPASEFAKLMAENGYSLVWGGSDVGLMKVIADGVKAGGGKLVGVSMEMIKDTAHKDKP